MKKLAIVLLCTFFASLSAYAQQAASWDLSRDLQISFAQGSNGVWYFMESESRVHDPAAYRLLPKYLAPCQNHDGVVAGVACWQGREAVFGEAPWWTLKSEVAFNSTDQPIDYRPGYDNFNPGYFPHRARVVATWKRFTMVAWQSPITGFVRVSARLNFRIAGAISENYFIDKGNKTLRSGTIGVGSDYEPRINISRVPVAKGDVLYFGFDGLQAFLDEPLGVYPADLQVKITQVP
jgi:hypothetical protein